MVDIETFIGRQREIAMVEAMVFDPQQRRHILPVLGPGGVGKTWLLRALYREFQQHPDVLVIRTEFAEVRSASLPTLAFNVFKQFSDYISQEERDEFQERLANWELEVKQDAASIGATIAEESIYLFGFGLIMRLLEHENKRLLFLSDTLESVKSLELAERINALSANFPNSVIVVVGRPTEEARAICARYPDIYLGWEVHPVHELEPFSLEETRAYYQSLLPMPIEDELLRKIYLLTGGSPILISITGEWLQRNIELPSDINLPLSELEAIGSQDVRLLKKFRRRFEFGLIDRIRALGQHIDIATLYLAYVNRRNDQRLLRIILDIDNDQDLEALETTLRGTVFVRKSMSSDGGVLHDEAQRLILEHAWPIIDPDGELRRTLARKVIDGFYLPEINRLRAIVREQIDRNMAQRFDQSQSWLPPIPEQDWEKRDLQIECLDYQFRISDADGWQYLEQLLDEALRFEYSFIQMDQIIGAIYNLAPKQASSTRFRARVAQILLHKGELQQAVAMARGVISSPDVSQADAVAALMVMGDAEPLPQARVTHYTNALTRAEGMPNKAPHAMVYRSLGRAYQQQGRWQEAADAFRAAMALIDRRSGAAQLALLLNGLAYSLAWLGQLHEADTAATLAEKLCGELNDQRGSAMACASKGIAAARRGDALHAALLLREASRLALVAGDVEGAALYQAHLGESELALGRYAEARRALQLALQSRSAEVRQLAHLQMAALLRDEALRPGLRAEGGDDRQRLALAGEHIHEALLLARRNGDQQTEAFCLLEQLELERHQSGRLDRELMSALSRLLETYDIPAAMGRFLELDGDQQLGRGQIERAFTLYADACLLLEGVGTAQLWPTFERVRRRLLDLDPEQAQLVHQLLHARLAGQHSAAAALLATCAFSAGQPIAL
jgi:tetratricopeptide (TPR) repeat protein